MIKGSSLDNEYIRKNDYSVDKLNCIFTVEVYF